MTKTSSKSNKKRKVAEPAATGNEDVTNINRYISNMLAISIGMKLADSLRRVCMYTKVGDQNKSFYAFFRGVFPIHELCGTVTALALARRDVLGQSTPLWKLLLPSVIIHSMANFRGMKVRLGRPRRRKLYVAPRTISFYFIVLYCQAVFLFVNSLFVLFSAKRLFLSKTSTATTTITSSIVLCFSTKINITKANLQMEFSNSMV